MILKGNSLFILLLIAFLPLIIFLFNPAITETLRQHSFDDGTYSHAYLIPLIYLYLCFHLYNENKLEFRNRLNWFYTFLFFLSCYFFFVTSTAQISLAYWLAHILIIITSTLVLFKYQLRIIFPALYLIFMYPLWGAMVYLLQDLSIATNRNIKICLTFFRYKKIYKELIARAVIRYLKPLQPLAISNVPSGILTNCLST